METLPGVTGTNSRVARAAVSYRRRVIAPGYRRVVAEIFSSVSVAPWIGDDGEPRSREAAPDIGGAFHVRSAVAGYVPARAAGSGAFLPHERVERPADADRVHGRPRGGAAGRRTDVRCLGPEEAARRRLDRLCRDVRAVCGGAGSVLAHRGALSSGIRRGRGTGDLPRDGP